MVERVWEKGCETGFNDIIAASVHLVAQRGVNGTSRRCARPRWRYVIFIGVMLNVPRLINEGALKGPVSSYTDEVFGAIWRIFEMEE